MSEEAGTTAPATKVRKRGSATEAEFADVVRPFVSKCAFLKSGDPPDKSAAKSTAQSLKRNAMIKAEISQNFEMWKAVCASFSVPSLVRSVVQGGLKIICLEKQQEWGMPEKKIPKWVALMCPRYNGQAAISKGYG